MVVGEEKAPQPQSHQPRWAVEMGLLGLWGAGTRVLAEVAVSLQPHSSATSPRGAAWAPPAPVGEQEPKGCSGGLEVTQ